MGGSLPVHRLIWCVLGVGLLHAAGNVVNDCYDFCLGADKKNTAGRYSGGSGILPQGLVEVGEAKIFYRYLLAAALIVALLLSQDSAWPFVMAIMGVLAALCYTMPPMKFAYRGLGELLVAMSFGPGIMLGTYYVLTGSFSISVLAVSAVVGALIGGVLIVNEFKDAATDRTAGKRNLAVRVIDLVARLSAAK